MNETKKTAKSGAAPSLEEAAAIINGAVERGDAPSVLIDLEQFVVDTSAPLAPPAYRLEIGGVGVLPPGITAVCGRAKQGKTQFLNVIVATLLSGREFGTMRAKDTVTRVVWIDTEQNRWEIQNNAKRMLRAAGLDETTDTRKIGLTILSLRECSADERCQVVQQALELDPQVIVIDGVRDLLHNFNDEGESFGVVEMLMNATTNDDLSLIEVLHKNDATDKMRGHLGTELFNKCNTLLECVKDNGYFTVKHISRQREANPFVFRINEAGDYEPASAAAAAGVIDDDAALAMCYDGDRDKGLDFAQLVKLYAKHASITQLKAKAIIKDKLNCHPPLIFKGDDKLFYLV